MRNDGRTATRRKRIAIYGLSALAAATAAFRFAGAGADVARVEAQVIAARTIFSSVTGMGRVYASVKADVSADLAGRVLEVRVREGDLVRKGDTLVILDPNDLDISVEAARAELAGAQSQHAAANAKQLQSAADSARIVRLAGLDPADVAREDLEKAYTNASVANAEVESTRHSIERASAQLEDALSSRKKASILAPLSGVVTRLSIAAGEAAVTNGLNKYTARLLTVADMSSLEIHVKLDETDVVSTTVGDSAIITLDALPSAPIAGRVTTISKSAVELPNATAGSQSAQYEVAIALLDPPAQIRSDFSGSAQILTGVVRSSVAVPLSALRGVETTSSAGAPRSGHQGDAETVVVVQPDKEHVELREIRLGLSDDQYVQVTRGLVPGELVVVAPFDVIRTLSDGAKVKVAQER
jgi:HlyD family secretion protein